MNQKIILASASPRRRELLAQIGLEFEVKVSNKEEVYTSIKPQKIVEELALMKAENVASDLQAEGVELKNTIVIGADTIVVRDEEILGKPKNEDHAYEILLSLQGRAHEVYTGVAILSYNNAGEKEIINHAVETKVHVHEMSEEEIRRANDLNGQLSLLKRKELQRIQSQSGSIRVSMVYLTMVQEAQNVVTYTINLMKVSRKFQIETD